MVVRLRRSVLWPATYEGVLTAIVSGRNDYCVRLRSGAREIEYSCDCPIGLEGEFCKHLVAAGLALIDSDADGKGKIGSEGRRESTEVKIHAFLEQQDKNTLIAMLKSEAMENRNLRERLLLEAARISPVGVDLAAYRRSIANATRTNGFVDYDSGPDYARRIHQVIESIAALLNDGHASAVIGLTEYVLAKLEDTIGDMDDSDGHMSVILPELHDLHHCACLKAKPDPNFIKLLEKIER